MEEKLKVVKTIHIALILGLILAYVFAGDLLDFDFFKIPEIKSSAYPFLLIPVATVFLGNFLYKQQLKNADKRLPLEDKIGVYQTASLIRWAVLEGAAFAILFVMPELIVVGLLLIAYLAFLKPSKDGMKRDFDSVI